jgi:predicted metal-dependent HD superfamily phosphohydrolase
MADLKKIWNEQAARYSDNEYLVAGLWGEIEKVYTTKLRYYHNLAHLEYMAERAIQYKDALTDFDTVMFSIIYHDIIYNTRRHDNEQKSADTARDRLTQLGVPTEKITKCQQQIIATKDHNDNVDEDTNFLVDFDLAILGDTPEKYQYYTKQIRREYSIYPDFLYKKGRKKVLQHFLAMDSIFKTDEFHNNYEQQARKNLTTELTGL